MSKGDLKIALVHDELIRRGGAEVVFEELTRMFPQADIYALYAGKPILEFDENARKIHTSFLQKLPAWFRRHPGRVLPLLPLAAEKFDFSKYDFVLSSASGFAKAIVTRSGIPHICYCHTPTRYVWEMTSPRLRGLGKLAVPIIHYLRMMDYAGAQRVDFWLANSEYTRQRIQKYYRRESEVVYPPIRTDFFTPLHSVRQSYAGQAPFLVVGRQSPTKNFEQARAVCQKLKLPLKVVGMGQKDGFVPDDELRQLYRQARALLVPGVEDFGMAAAEALACGTPVIAQNAGGIREIVRHNETGILYDGQSVEALAEGIRQFLDKEGTFQKTQLARSVAKFSREEFVINITNAIAKTLAVWNA